MFRFGDLMVYEYDAGNNTLYLDSVELPLHSQEENIIGTCSNCNSDVQSVSYHRRNDQNVVAAKCKSCSTFHAIVYDDVWNWLGEEHVSTSIKPDYADVKNEVSQTVPKTQPNTEELNYLNSIPLKKLSAVFSPAEIEAMFLKVSEQKYVRQYLYRARKKYHYFNELFDIIINI